MPCQWRLACHLAQSLPFLLDDGAMDMLGMHRRCADYMTM